MDTTELVENLKKIDTMLSNNKESQEWISLTLQEVIFKIEKREKDLVALYKIPQGWTGTVTKKIK